MFHSLRHRLAVGHLSFGGVRSSARSISDDGHLPISRSPRGTENTEAFLSLENHLAGEDPKRLTNNLANPMTFFHVALLLLISISGLASAKNLGAHCLTLSDAVWFPNGQSTDGVNVVEENKTYYVALDGGLGQWNTVTNDLLVHEIPAWKEGQYSQISSIERAGNQIWVGTRRHGIHFFDPVSSRFVGRHQVTQETFFGANANLTFMLDEIGQSIWVSSCLKLDSYDLKDHRWTDHRKGIEEISRKLGGLHTTMAEKEAIWLLDSSGWFLLKYPRNSKKWVDVGSDILRNEPHPKAFGMNSLLFSDQFIWVFITENNANKLSVAEQIKGRPDWKIFKTEELIGPVTRMIENAPQLRGGGLDLLIQAIPQYQIKENWPVFGFRFTEEYVRKLTALTTKFEKTVPQELLSQRPSLRTFKAWTADDQVKILNPDLSKVVTRQIPGSPVRFNYIVAAIDDSLIVGTNRGIELFDVKNATIQPVKGLELYAAPDGQPEENPFRSRVSMGPLLYLCDYFIDPGMGEDSHSRIVEFDTVALTAKFLAYEIQIKEISTLEGRLSGFPPYEPKDSPPWVWDGKEWTRQAEGPRAAHTIGEAARWIDLGSPQDQGHSKPPPQTFKLRSGRKAWCTRSGLRVSF